MPLSPYFDPNHSLLQEYTEWGNRFYSLACTLVACSATITASVWTSLVWAYREDFCWSTGGGKIYSIPVSVSAWEHPAVTRCSDNKSPAFTPWMSLWSWKCNSRLCQWWRITHIHGCNGNTMSKLFLSYVLIWAVKSAIMSLFCLLELSGISKLMSIVFPIYLVRKLRHTVAKWGRQHYLLSHWHCPDQHCGFFTFQVFRRLLFILYPRPVLC